MISLYLCDCVKEENFQIVRLYDPKSGLLQNIYFRCDNCGKEHSLEDVKEQQ